MGYREEQGEYSWRYITKQRQLRYQHLVCVLYNDALISKINRIRGAHLDNLSSLILTYFIFDDLCLINLLMLLLHIFFIVMVCLGSFTDIIQNN